MTRPRGWGLGVVLLGMLACSNRAEQPVRESRLSLVETLSGADTAGYARATVPRPFTFPQDHGPHRDFRSEWWYVTGNLTSSGGREFGFQLTVFRSSLSPLEPSSPSAWATNQAYMGHFAVTDPEGEAFLFDERLARGAVGLAGAEADPVRIWVHDWELSGTEGAGFPLRLTAATEGATLSLALETGKGPVLQGDRGLSRKGPEPGNASYYYSHTRLPAFGTLVLDGEELPVSGSAWLDREWSTSALSEGLVGWDWFALQLDDGWDLMVYRLRRGEGSTAPYSEGVLVDPEGEATRVRLGADVVVERVGAWTSPIDGAEYPSGWLIRVPARGWDLRVDTVLEDQELDLSFRYWEGAVRVAGVGEGGSAVTGRGYVELTGYAESARF